MKRVAQLNHEDFFLYPAPAYGEGMPGGAIEAFPGHWEDDVFVLDDLPEHHRWRYNGQGYESVPDYRGQVVYRIDGTSYYPVAWGPLPEGDSLTPPPPTPEQIAVEARQYVMGELAALDAEYYTPRTLAGLAIGDEYAIEAHHIHEAKAELWRERLAAIPISEDVQ